MAITYPRSLPANFKVKAFSLTIVRQQVIAQTRGGAVQAAERGRSLWQAEGEMSLLSPANFDEIQAFFDSLRGSLNTFRLHNFGRKRPIAYPGTGWAGFTRHGGGAFDGTCTVVSASGYTASLSGLPTSFLLSAGDMISWPFGSTRTLHRIVEGGIASAGALSVQVEPDVPAGGSYSNTAMLENAQGIFRLLPNEPSGAQYLPGFGDGMTFKAIQALY